MMRHSLKTGFYVAAQNNMQTPWIYGPRFVLTPSAWAIVLQMGRYSVALGRSRKAGLTA